MESAASGLLAARSIACHIKGKNYRQPPHDTMCGALMAHITTQNKDFQPMGANMGILPALTENKRGKRERYMAFSIRALESMRCWLQEIG